ncbi:hypothetical protein QBC37DRAFT_419865 [Rhypophila decipiens]|uniref:Uncharacterized protein n=1 Tax=Rhypophila decipiens TaxID=261697 RepID=A0AAN7B6Y7_9PEZI|nr:hypothetical protein QBC37DRAFT_419865 [Rhypophila decipiens]
MVVPTHLAAQIFFLCAIPHNFAGQHLIQHRNFQTQARGRIKSRAMAPISWLADATRDQIDYILSHLDVTSIHMTGNSTDGGFGTFTFNIPPSPATSDIPDAAAADAASVPAESGSFWTFWHIVLVVIVVLFVGGLIGGIASTEDKIEAVDTKLKALLERTQAAGKEEEQIDLESGNAESDGSTTPADDSESLDSDKASEDEATKFAAHGRI